MEFNKINQFLVILCLITVSILLIFVDIFTKNLTEIYVNQFNISDVTRMYKIFKQSMPRSFNESL